MAEDNKRDPPNMALRQARRRLPSPTGSGQEMSRQELAQAVNDYLWRSHRYESNIDRSYVGKLERGKHRWPGPMLREGFRTVLKAQTNAEIGFFIVRKPRTTDDDIPPSSIACPTESTIETAPSPDAVPTVPAQASDEAAVDTGWADMVPGDVARMPSWTRHLVNRRRAAALIATTLAAASSPTREIAGWLVDRRPRPRTDRSLLAAHIEMGELLAGMYRSVDPRAVLPMATAYADDLLDQFDDADSVEFAHLVVGVHAQVGLWACHAHLPSHARRYLATACEVAASRQDRPLCARALGALSYLHSSAPRGGAGGNPQYALRLLDDALTMAEKADPFTRGWLATWRADQHATLGNLTAAQADIDLATAALGAGDDGQTIGFFSRQHYGYGMQGHLDSVYALVHGLAGETDEAERVFALVHAQAANGRRRAATFAHQALAYAKASSADPEAACAALRKSISLAASDHYAMGLKRAAGVRRGFNRRWSDLSCVRDIDEQLQQPATVR